MRKKLIGLGGGLAMLVALAVGCADQGGPTALELDSGPRMDHVVTTSEEVKVLERAVPLAKDVVVRARIGRDGGEVKIKDAGLYVSFPAGALLTQTEIVVTAKAGTAFLFDFGPSPLHFAKPVKIEVDLKNSTAYGNPDLITKLRGAFYPGSALDAVKQLLMDGTVLVTELYPVEPDVNKNKVKFFVDHFSGYLLSVP